MKHLLAPIVLMTFLFPSLALGEGVTVRDLVVRHGLYYKKFSDVPFTGKVTGQRERGQFKDGKKEGPWASYWSNGQLSYKGHYKTGNREGDWMDYNKDGTINQKYSGTFKNGMKISE